MINFTFVFFGLYRIALGIFLLIPLSEKEICKKPLSLYGATKLFNELKDCSFLKKYIHVTTPEVYGSCSGYIKEDMTYNPSTPYAASRAAGDMSLKTFVDNYNFPAVSTRAANVFGPGQQLYRIIPRTILYIRQGKSFKKMYLIGLNYSITI